MSIVPISTVTIDRIKLTPPTPNIGHPPKDGNTMRFAKIGYPSKPPKLSFTAKAVEIDFTQEEYGGGLYIKVKPEFKDLVIIQQIDELLEGDMKEKFRSQIGFDGEYEHRSCTDDMDTLRLKLKQKDGAFVAEMPWTTEEEVVEKISCGTRLNAVVSCGFYFSEAEPSRDTAARYGVYWTLKSLDVWAETPTVLAKKLVKKTKKDVV